MGEHRETCGLERLLTEALHARAQYGRCISSDAGYSALPQRLVKPRLVKPFPRIWPGQVSLYWPCSLPVIAHHRFKHGDTFWMLQIPTLNVAWSLSL